MTSSIESDETLLERTAAGCEESFTALYRRHQGRIYRFAYAMSGSESVAEEVTQEVFLAMLREMSGFEASRGGLAGYLIGAARNHVLRLLRKDQPYVPLAGDEDADLARGAAFTPAPPDALDGLTRKESVEAVRRAVLALPAAYREAVVLCDLQEMDYAGAADVLGCAVGTVRSRLHRGRAMLAVRLKAERERREAVPGFRPTGCLA